MARPCLRKATKKEVILSTFIFKASSPRYVYFYKYVYRYIHISVCSPHRHGTEPRHYEPSQWLLPWVLGSGDVIVYWYMIGKLPSNGYPCFMESWSQRAAAEELGPKVAGTQGWNRPNKPRLSSNLQEAHPLCSPGAAPACWPPKQKERHAAQTLDPFSAAPFLHSCSCTCESVKGRPAMRRYNFAMVNGGINSHPSQPPCGLPGETVTKK